MKNTRRLTAFLFLGSSFVALAAAQSIPERVVPHTHLALVGTYTTKTQSKGIYAFSYDPETGKLTPKGLAAETPDPSWVIIHPSGKYAYAANEAGKQSAVSAFALDAQTGKLTLLNQLPALGEDPCYLSFDRTGKFLFVANYTSGNIVVFPILPDGTLGTATANVKDAGNLGPNKERQEGPHAHWIEISAHNRFAYVADLGLDRVLFYDFNPAKGTLALHDATVSDQRPFAQNSLELKSGTGPRHVAIAKNHNLQQFIYVLGELDSTVTVFGDSKEGIFSSFQEISTLPPGFSGRNDAAEIVIHPSGKWLFASNRGKDSIAVFALEPGNGTLRYAGDFPTGGKEPRHFALDPAGRYLLAENQNSGTIVTFRFDATSGQLTPTGDVVSVPSPVCLAFVP